MKRVIIGGHVAYVCARDHDDRGCMFCDGGLFACAVCDAFEGATPDDCPGVRMTKEQSDAVYAGRLNYRAGEWRQECCQIMRHAYDVDAYMAEEGYVCDGVNAAGNPRCGLCGHVMTLDRCGWGAVNDVPLCHADDHDCYHLWTVYGRRPVVTNS